jgi:hypothetical protein
MRNEFSSGLLFQPASVPSSLLDDESRLLQLSIAGSIPIAPAAWGRRYIGSTESGESNPCLRNNPNQGGATESTDSGNK